MKIVLTGGHLSPLLAVLEAISSDFEVLVIGRKYALEGDKVQSLEYKTIVDKGINFKSITSGRLQRKFTRHTLFSLLKLPYGFVQSFLILKKFKPDVVLSFGGYVSLPVTLSSFFMRIPVVIHEQTLEAGLANKIASIFAKKVCISFESSKSFFPASKTVLTGNPIRKFRIQNSRLAAKRAEFRIQKNNLPLIYVTGGSSGSHAINVLVEGCLEKLLTKYKIIHQTGDAKEYGDFDRLGKNRERLNEQLKSRYILTKFVDPSEVGEIFKEADLVVSRSGANTVSELMFFKKPSLLIPLPFSQNNEQFKNAVFLKETGLSEILDQNKVTSEDIYKKISYMLENPEKYQKLEDKAKKLVIKNAAEKIIDVLNSVVK